MLGSWLILTLCDVKPGVSFVLSSEKLDLSERHYLFFYSHLDNFRRKAPKVLRTGETFQYFPDYPTFVDVLIRLESEDFAEVKRDDLLLLQKVFEFLVVFYHKVTASLEIVNEWTLAFEE